MPFWSLNHDLQFSSLSKIWVSFRATGILMALTFVVGVYWSKIIPQTATPPEELVTEEGNPNITGDEELLEPKPNPDAGPELLCNVIGPIYQQIVAHQSGDQSGNQRSDNPAEHDDEE